MTKKTLKSEIFDIPYADRQLIIVLPDKVVSAINTELAEAGTKKKEASWTDLALEVLKTINTGTYISILIDEALKAWAKARSKGMDVLHVAQSDAAKLKLPPGHPRENVLYVGHPADPGVYYTVASFHRMTFEHKFSEAVRLLMCLGATDIRVEHMRGWDREFTGAISGLSPVGDKVETNVSGKSAEKASLLYVASLKGTNEPKIPDSLVWYPHETTWQSIAEGRIHFGLHEFSLTVNYEDDFGINSELKASAKGIGFELGGSFDGHQATTWILSGKFTNS